MNWWQGRSSVRGNADTFEGNTLPEIGVSSVYVPNADYILSNADHGKYVYMADNSVARTVYVPEDLLPDFTCGIVRWGSAGVTISGSGTTLQSISGFRNVSAQYGLVGIAPVGFTANTFLLCGALS